METVKIKRIISCPGRNLPEPEPLLHGGEVGAAPEFRPRGQEAGGQDDRQRERDHQDQGKGHVGIEEGQEHKQRDGGGARKAEAAWLRAREASVRQEGAGCPGTPRDPADSAHKLRHGCSCADICGRLQEGVSRQMGSGGGEDRYGFPGGRVSTLGD